MGFSFRQLTALAVAVGCVTLTSCGSGRYVPIPETGATLEGTVSYGGQKLSAALIVVAGSGGSAQAMIGDDGRYKVESAPLGEVTVAVNTAAARGMLAGRAQGKTSVKIIDVPGKYADPVHSGIKTTVNKGTNTYDIVIPK